MGESKLHLTTTLVVNTRIIHIPCKCLVWWTGWTVRNIFKKSSDRIPTHSGVVIYFPTDIVSIITIVISDHIQTNEAEGRYVFKCKYVLESRCPSTLI